MSEKIGKRLRKNLRVKGTSSHFTQIQFRTCPHFCLLFNAYTRLFFSIYLLVLIFEKSSQRHGRN